MKHLLIITIFLLPTLALAQGYTPMIDIGINPGQNFNGYIDALYALSISIAALLAVIKIVIAGVKWMMSDVVTNKAEAKNDIYGALIGLLIVLSAVLILTVINPNLKSVNLNLTPVAQPTATPAVQLVQPLSPGQYTSTPTLDYVPDSVSSSVLQSFLNTCSLSGPNTSFRTYGGYHHCFKLPPGNVVYETNYCLAGPANINTASCQSLLQTKQNDCVNNFSGTFYTNDPVLNYGYCIHP